jgi:hypothetical protein
MDKKEPENPEARSITWGDTPWLIEAGLYLIASIIALVWGMLYLLGQIPGPLPLWLSEALWVTITMLVTVAIGTTWFLWQRKK